MSTETAELKCPWRNFEDCLRGKCATYGIVSLTLVKNCGGPTKIGCRRADAEIFKSEYKEVNHTKKIDSQIPRGPVNVKKIENKICSADCPSCGYNFPDIGGVWESYGEVEQYHFCPECGQKIDWDET